MPDPHQSLQRNKRSPKDTVPLESVSRCSERVSGKSKFDNCFPFLYDNSAVLLFIIVELVLYVSFLSCDIMGVRETGTVLKYMSLLLCLLYSVNGTAADGRLVSRALCLTACADLFLLVLDCFYSVGVALFCIVQILYAMRLYTMIQERTGVTRPLHCILVKRIAVSAAFLVAVTAAGYFVPLTLLACVYFPQLLCNALASLRCIDSQRGRCFSAGLWLFLFCDVCVGLHYMGAASGGAAARWIGIGMWAFYLPSQVLIVLSALQRRIL